MQLSGQNLSTLQNSINFNNGDVKDGDVNKEDKSVFAKGRSKKHQIDSATFVQTKKDNRTSKVPSVKIEIGKNLSNLVMIDRSLGDIKTNFENVEKALNIESESKTQLPAERKKYIDENVDEIKTIINETKVADKKIFLSNFKIDVQTDLASNENYKAKVDFAGRFSKFDLDFEAVETNLDKRFHQIREVNKNLSTIDSIKEEVQTHTKVLKKQMDKFISVGKSATLYHLSSKLEESNEMTQMKLKASIFMDIEKLAIAQVNTNSANVLNLLP